MRKPMKSCECELQHQRSLVQSSCSVMSSHPVCVHAIPPSNPLSTPSPPAFNLSQHQGLFQWVSSLHQMTQVLKFQLQHQSFQWTPRAWSPSGWTGWISLQSKILSRVFSNTTVQKHQFFCAQLSSQSNSQPQDKMLYVIQGDIWWDRSSGEGRKEGRRKKKWQLSPNQVCLIKKEK